MSDTTDSQRPHPTRPDLARVAFWACLAAGVAGAGVVLAAGPGAGRAGAVLLISLAAAGMVFLAWLSREGTRKAGLFPERGSTAGIGNGAGAEFQLLDAIEEPALITTRTGAPVTANSAYLALATSAEAMGESARPPGFERLFGADPLVGPFVFRLSRAALGGQSRREMLPPTRLSGSDQLIRFEAMVGPAPGGHILWRLRPAATGDYATHEEARQLFIEDAPVGFFAAKADGSLVYMNQALRAVLGCGDVVHGLRVRDILKEDPARVLRRDRRGGAMRAPITLRAVDGMETSAQALSIWPAGEADGSTRTFVFFNESGQTQAELAAQSARDSQIETDAFFANAPLGAALLDGTDPATAAILDANSALMDISQGRAAPGSAFADMFDASEGPVALGNELRKCSSQPVELQLATQPARAAHVYLARTEDGRGLAYVVNVTEQRELEQRLSQAEKMREIGMLAGGVAHDFNNLLMVVMQNCDYLLRRHPVGDPDYLDLSEINHHALRAKELSEMLRAYARQQTFRREVVDVSAFLAQMHELVRRLMGEIVKVDVRHGRDLPYIKVDKSQLERVLINLATNGRDAMRPKDSATPRDGKFSIRTARTTAEEARALGHTPIEEGEYLLIEVADTGGGIKPEDQAKIFRPFHSTKENGKGTGLGLATSYGIIKQSEGYIFFDSKLGKGTTFRIYLPAYEPTPADLEDMAQKEREALHRIPADVSGRGKILLVEDEERLRKSIARNLSECGYEIDEAEDGDDGLQMLTASPGGYDLIISDVTMPIMSGPEMLQTASAEQIGKAKVLFLSGYAPEEFAQILEKYPVAYMSKPVGLGPLAQRVKELLAA
jgi:two-component system cell cycle sensor histidine kinase/response regulator CckA